MEDEEIQDVDMPEVEDVEAEEEATEADPEKK